MISDERLDEWQRLSDTATAGPWIWKGCDVSMSPEGFDQDPIGLHSETKEYFVLTPEVRLLEGRMYIRIGSHSGSKHIRSDYEFISSARTAVPDLIAEVRRLKAELSTRTP